MAVSEVLLTAIVSGASSSALVSGFWAFLGSRSAAHAKQPSDMLEAQAHMQTAMAAQAKAFTDSMMTLVAHQNSELASVRTEIARLAEAERLCRNEADNLRGVVDGLVRRLRAAGIDVDPHAGPKPHARVVQPFAEMSNGEVTLYQEKGRGDGQ